MIQKLYFPLTRNKIIQWHETEGVCSVFLKSLEVYWS